MTKSAASTGPEPDQPYSFEKIADVAEKLFYENGFASTSIRDICDRLGIVQGTLYYHVRSKEDLLYRIIVRTHGHILANLERLSSSTEQPAYRMREYFEGHARVITDHLAASALFHRDARHLTPEHRAEVVSIRDDIERLMGTVMLEAQQQGVVSGKVNLHIATLCAFGAINAMHEWYTPDGDESAAEVARAVSEFVLAGLTGQHRLADQEDPPTAEGS